MTRNASSLPLGVEETVEAVAEGDSVAEGVAEAEAEAEATWVANSAVMSPLKPFPLGWLPM